MLNDLNETYRRRHGRVLPYLCSRLAARQA